MEKKTKLTISGTAKKSFKNIELAKTQGKNSVVIEKQPSKFPSRSGSSRPGGFKSKTTSTFNRGAPVKPSFAPKSPPITNDFERRKLAEQRATKRLKGDNDSKDKKTLKSGTKKRELKLTVSRALSDEIEARERSLASVKRARQKENKNLTKEEAQESLKPVKRDVNIPEAITVRELANRMAEQSSNVIKFLFGMGVTVTINQTLASDTAEYLVKEFGHNPIREEKAEEIIQKIKASRAENLKNRYFSQEEKAAFAELKGEFLRANILSHWIIKEAAIKWQQGSLAQDLTSWEYCVNSQIVQHRRLEHQLSVHRLELS